MSGKKEVTTAALFVAGTLLGSVVGRATMDIIKEKKVKEIDANVASHIGADNFSTYHVMFTQEDGVNFVRVMGRAEFSNGEISLQESTYMLDDGTFKSLTKKLGKDAKDIEKVNITFLKEFNNFLKEAEPFACDGNIDEDVAIGLV